MLKLIYHNHNISLSNAESWTVDFQLCKHMLIMCWSSQKDSVYLGFVIYVPMPECPYLLEKGFKQIMRWNSDVQRMSKVNKLVFVNFIKREKT